MQRIDINYDPYKIETEMHVNGVNVCDNIDDYAQFKVFIDDKIPLQMWIEPNDSENWKGIVNELKTDEEGFDILEFHFHGREIDFEDLQRACEMQNANRVNKIELIFKHDTIRSDKKTDESYQTIIDEFLSQRFSSLVYEQGVDSSVFLEYQKFKDSYEQINEKNVATDSLKIPSGLYSDSEMGQENIAKYLDPYIINRKAELINDGLKVIELLSDIQTQSMQDMDKRVDEYVRKRLETDPYILRVKTAPDTQTLKDIEVKHITRQIAGVFEELWDEIENAYDETFAEYNSTISDTVDDLNDAAVQLYDYGIHGYRFGCSTDLEEIQLENAHDLAEEMLKSKEIKAKWNKTIKRNPIKTKHYNNWQLIGKMKQALAEDTVETGEFIYWNQFSMVSLKTYITEKAGPVLRQLLQPQNAGGRGAPAVYRLPPRPGDRGKMDSGLLSAHRARHQRARLRRGGPGPLDRPGARDALPGGLHPLPGGRKPHLQAGPLYGRADPGKDQNTGGGGASHRAPVREPLARGLLKL